MAEFLGKVTAFQIENITGVLSPYPRIEIVQCRYCPGNHVVESLRKRLRTGIHHFDIDKTQSLGDAFGDDGLFPDGIAEDEPDFREHHSQRDSREAAAGPQVEDRDAGPAGPLLENLRTDRLQITRNRQ